MTTRPDWDTYYLGVAQALKVRGDCSRRQVGAVLVRADRRQAGSGYNGVAPGDAGCLESPCLRVRKAERGEDVCPGYSDCRAAHAEANALLDADRDDRRGATLYITEAPCNGCMKLIAVSGVKRVIWPTGFHLLA
ncbi:deoxycytidylate deaminase [Microtetraspora malaysiensis]|uniref:deoxycytidylate deaminase n=1 Tax=Microtetraspora malaysiensis TaxID=161358 RepID=UPI003D91D401